MNLTSTGLCLEFVPALCSFLSSESTTSRKFILRCAHLQKRFWLPNISFGSDTVISCPDYRGPLTVITFTDSVCWRRSHAIAGLRLHILTALLETWSSYAAAYFSFCEHTYLKTRTIMAGSPNPPIMTNGNSPAAKPIELAVQMPYAPDSRIHLHLTILTTSIVLFVTSTNHESSGVGASLGSFVYAMPDVRLRSPLLHS